MRDIKQWSNERNADGKPWLILGSGPSLQKIREFDLGQYYICSLDHVVRELPVTLAFISDRETLRASADQIDRNAGFLVMPNRPHSKNSPNESTLQHFVPEIPALEKMDSEGRLLWYSALFSKENDGADAIEKMSFAAGAALSILVACGAKEVRSLGVHDRQSVGRQFQGICDTIRMSNVSYAPLDVSVPIRVFVGTDAFQMFGVKMLEYSIKKHTPASVEVVVINDQDLPVPVRPENRSRSGFSFCRFNIPKLCGYKGRAIYMDADMQIFTDLTKLWSWDMEEADIVYCQQPAERGRIPQFSVMVMNCANWPCDAREIVQGLDQNRYTYQELMGNFCVISDDRKKMELPFEWNSLEYYEEGKTCLIHYTDMNTQPWVSDKNLNGHLWYQLLREAVQEGFVTMEDLYTEIDKGHVSPDLPRWAGLPVLKNSDELLKNWVPPYKRFSGVAGVRLNAKVLQQQNSSVG